MTFEQEINNWLSTKIDDGTFLDAKLSGIRPDVSAEAIVIIPYFGDSQEKIILIQPDGITFKYKLVSNKRTIELNLPDKDDIINRLENLEDKINKIYTYISNSVPKNTTETSYKTDKTNLIMEFWKFMFLNYPNLIDSDIREGITYYNENDTDLTSEQIVKKIKFSDWYNKLVARNQIELEVGDEYDLLADVSKRLALNERLLMRISNQIFSGVTMEQDYIDRYSAFVSAYLEAVDSYQFMDRADLENEGELFQSLMAKAGKITQIVKEEYFDKKV